MPMSWRETRAPRLFALQALALLCQPIFLLAQKGDTNFEALLRGHVLLLYTPRA